MSKGSYSWPPLIPTKRAEPRYLQQQKDFDKLQADDDFIGGCFIGCLVGILISALCVLAVLFLLHLDRM